MNPPSSMGHFGPEPGDWSPPVPAGIFLDTSIVSLLDDFGEQLWDAATIDGSLPAQLARQLDALRVLMTLTNRAYIAFGVSQAVIDQAAARPGGHRYAEELLAHWEQARLDYGIQARGLAPMTLVADLPPGDQLVLAEAYRSGCEAVLTNDLAWVRQRHRRTIAALGMAAYTPESLVEQLRPWLDLWL